jgi:hypothetical protein
MCLPSRTKIVRWNKVIMNSAENLQMVGTVVMRRGQFSLITDGGSVTLVGDPRQIRPWDQQRVVVNGRPISADSVQVQSVEEMMTAQDTAEFTRFLVERYGAAAADHAGSKLELAVRSGRGRDAEVWASVVRRLKSSIATKMPAKSVFD